MLQSSGVQLLSLGICVLTTSSPGRVSLGSALTAVMDLGMGQRRILRVQPGTHTPVVTSDLVKAGPLQSHSQSINFPARQASQLGSLWPQVSQTSRHFPTGLPDA